MFTNTCPMRPKVLYLYSLMRLHLGLWIIHQGGGAQLSKRQLVGEKKKRNVPLSAVTAISSLGGGYSEYVHSRIH